ncbi:MAG: hypothetical protein H0X24_03365 [Ktedonobacterales bacterium]|nr:hypothetical protein [Ktedonobacterales bacterium]
MQKAVSISEFGLICAGTSSQAFTLSLCRACRDQQMQDKIVSVGVHPCSGTAKMAVKKLRDMGIKAQEIEKPGVSPAEDVAALSQLLQGFRIPTVTRPKVVVVLLDEDFIARPELMMTSWQTINRFKEDVPATDIIVIFFTKRSHYAQAQNPLAPLKALLIANQQRAILISKNAELKSQTKQYHDTLARQLGILLTAEESGTFRTTFREQLSSTETPFVALALSEVAPPRAGSPWALLQGRFPASAKSALVDSMATALRDLLNTPETRPPTSFGWITPDARRHGAEMLSIVLFTPRLHKDDRKWLDEALEKTLAGFGVDPQGTIQFMAPTPAGGVNAALQQFSVISCSSLALTSAPTLLDRIPVVKELVKKRSDPFQLLILFGLDAATLA